MPAKKQHQKGPIPSESRSGYPSPNCLGKRSPLTLPGLPLSSLLRSGLASWLASKSPRQGPPRDADRSPCSSVTSAGSLDRSPASSMCATIDLGRSGSGLAQTVQGHLADPAGALAASRVGLPGMIGPSAPSWVPVKCARRDAYSTDAGTRMAPNQLKYLCHSHYIRSWMSCGLMCSISLTRTMTLSGVTHPWRTQETV